MEVWQEVFGFCPFEEYATMALDKPASREFYYLLKQSLLELRFGSALPSPALGGLWMASRDVLASLPRVLRLGLCLSLCVWTLFLLGAPLVSLLLLLSPRKHCRGVSSGSGASGGDRAAVPVAEAGREYWPLEIVLGGDPPASGALCP